MGTRLGYTSELKQTELADGLKTEGKGKEGIKTNSWVFDVSKSEKGVPIHYKRNWLAGNQDIRLVILRDLSAKVKLAIRYSSMDSESGQRGQRYKFGEWITMGEWVTSATVGENLFSENKVKQMLMLHRSYGTPNQES